MTTSAYHQPVPRFWWAKRRSYLLFMLRELSCVAVAWTVVFVLIGVAAIGRGDYRGFLDFSAHPAVVLVNIVALAFLLLHAVTWFGLAPRAMVIHLGGRRVPSSTVLAGHYAAWLVVSAVIVWLVLS
ncbi:fumarate reductase [Mycolicibacterium brisbanense]|uniref:Fumarate reductase subunit C n=1 Tax=Mycolicibacterium brisbanense TaxID=146020 RepID=A0A100VV97_9MYCO|nr:fumarate reductase [Mycolicibacterium brisbanense]MCV7156614.1 fumarate reductase subunit C [Mycolicibacterium brisbanense]GAS86511.1 fumarate reductase subunit C [Mycolicibacterium brisbanense]